MSYGELVLEIVGSSVGGTGIAVFIGFILDYIRSMFFGKD